MSDIDERLWQIFGGATDGRLHRNGRLSTWGKPMPRWYWRVRNNRGLSGRLIIDEVVSSGMEVLPDGSTRHWESRNGQVTERITPPPPTEPLPVTDEDRTAYIEWSAAQPAPVRDWLARYPTLDDLPVCWRLANTDGHYVLASIDLEDTLTCQVRHVAGPGARFTASILGFDHGVFGVPIDDLAHLGPSTAPDVTCHVNRLGPEASIGDVCVALEALEARGVTRKLPDSVDGWALNALSSPPN